MVSEKKLIEGVKRGCSNSERILYNKYKKILSSYLTNKYGFLMDKDDIISEVLIKIFTSINTYNPQKKSFKSWCITILTYHMVDLWRKSTLKPVYESEDFILENLFSDPSSTDNVLMNDLSDLVGSINITISDLKLLELKYVYNYTYDDISVYSGISVTKLSNRVNYVKTKIKKIPHQNGETVY